MPIPPEIGRRAWHRLHQWADDFRAEVQASGSDCGCGEFAQKAARALHDTVSAHLGKPVQFPDDLRLIYKGMGEALETMTPYNGANGDNHANEVYAHQYSRGRCMDCPLPPTWEFLWAEGMSHAWFCDKHSEEFRKREMWHGVSQISAERPLRYGVASRLYRDGPPTQKEADKYLASMRQEFLQAVMSVSRVIPREQMGFESILLPKPSPEAPATAPAPDAIRVVDDLVAATPPESDAKPGYRLFDYQEAALEWLTGRDAALLADEMGVGKTAAAIAWAADKGPVLVVVPASLVYNWKKEIKENWRRRDTVQVVTPDEPFQERLPDWSIVSYGQVGNLSPLLRQAGFRTLICDEAHTLRNWTTGWTQNVMDLVDPEHPSPSDRPPQYRLLVTGTPIVNDEEDLLPYLVILGKKAIREWLDLDALNISPREYAAAVRRSFRTRETFPGQKNALRTQWRNNLARIMLRRRKSEVLNLPDKTQTILPVAITTVEEYRQAEGAFIDWLKSSSGIMGPKGEAAIAAEALVRLQALRGIAARGKVAPVAAYLRACGMGEKAIVFSNYLEPLESLKALKGSGLLYTGSLSKEDRQSFVDRFQRDPGECYFLGTYGAAGVGITLTAADKVVLLDLPWTPAAKQQAEDRAHRVGQRRNVNVVTVIAKNTIDERVLEILSEKEQIVGQIVEGKAANDALNSSVAYDVLRRIRATGQVGLSQEPPIRYISDEEYEGMVYNAFAGKVGQEGGKLAATLEELEARYPHQTFWVTRRQRTGIWEGLILTGVSEEDRRRINSSAGGRRQTKGEVIQFLDRALQEIGVQPIIGQSLLFQLRDPYGSRCRDPLSGMWTFRDFCGPLETEFRPQPDVIVQPPVSNRTLAIAADGLKQYEFENRLVEADDLIPSHNPFTFEVNPAFAQKLQPRIRDRAAAELQVMRIAAQLSPDSLLTDFHTLDRGAPIVGPDMLVESGNGRVMGIIRAVREFPDNYAAYRQAMGPRLAQLGLSTTQADQMAHPVLVRVRLTPLTDQERQAFVIEANTPAGLSRSAIEQARTDAEKITLDMLDSLDIGENESIFDALRASRNATFIRAFLGGVPENERGGLLDARGTINMDGIRRAAQAVFVAAFGSGEPGMRLGEMAFESADQDVKNIINGIARALGPLAQAEALVRAKARDINLAIGVDLAQAVIIYAKVKNDPSLTVEKYLAQSQMFSRELSPFQERILVVLDTYRRSAARLGRILRWYGVMVRDQPPLEQMGLFGGVDRPTQEELWEKAVQLGASDTPIPGATPELVPASQAQGALRYGDCVMTKEGRVGILRGGGGLGSGRVQVVLPSGAVYWDSLSNLRRGTQEECERQLGLFQASQTFRERIHWCNVKPEAQSRILNWRPMRDFVYQSVGYGVVAEICEAGFGGDQYQVTVGYVGEGTTRKGILKLDQLAALQKAAGRMGNLARQVFTTQPGVLVYQVNLPKQEEESLVFMPMFPGSERAGLLPRQTEPAEQAPLFMLQRMAEQEQHASKRGEIQSLIFSKDSFSEGAAKAWAQHNDFRYGDVDETPNTWRLRQYAPDLCPTTFRTITLTKGVQAVICASTLKVRQESGIYPWPEGWFEDEEDDDDGGLEKKETKHKKPTTSQEQGVYVSWALSPDSDARMRRFITQDLRLPEPTWPLHITTVHSKRPFEYRPAPRPLPTEDLELRVKGYGLLTGPNSDSPSLVLYVDAPALQDSHTRAAKAGASWDFPEFAPHLTLAYGGTLPAKVDLLMKPDFTFTLSPQEKVEPLKENWRPPVLSQSFLQSVLAAAVSGGSATFGAMLVSRFLEKRKEEEQHPGRRLVGIVDDTRKDNNKEGGRPGGAAAPGFTPVPGVAIVEGDMIQADLGPLLQDLDAIIHRGEMGEVSTKTLRVTRE